MATHSSAQAALVLRAVLSLGRRLRAARPPGGVTLAELSALSTIRRLGALPARQIATEEQLQPQSLTRLIAGLERKRLIVRARSDQDHRKILIGITPQGESVVDADLRARKAWLERALTGAITDRERADLFAGCEVMLRLVSYRA